MIPLPTVDQFYVAFGAGGIVIVLLIAGVFTLGRETKRERGIADVLLENNGKLANAAERMAEAWEAQTSKAGRGR